MLNLLIADDNMVFVKGLSNYILEKDKNLRLVKIASNGLEILNIIQETNIDLILLDLTVLFYIVTCYRVNKVSAWLFAPYVLWLILATYLNVFIVINNPM